MQPLNNRHVDLVTPVDLQSLRRQAFKIRVGRRDHGHLGHDLVIFRVGIARELIRANRLTRGSGIAAVEEIQRCKRVFQAGTMAKHVKPRRTISHILERIGAKIGGGVKTGITQHFNQYRHDITVDTLKAGNGAVHGFAVFLPHAVTIQRVSGIHHQRGTFFEAKFTRLVFLDQRLHAR